MIGVMHGGANLKRDKLPGLTVTTDAAGIELMRTAAAYVGAPLSIWASMVLLEEARAAAHKRKSGIGGEKKYQWGGKDCTREYHEEMTAKMEARKREVI